MDERPHDFTTHSDGTPGAGDFGLDDVNASLEKAVWLAKPASWSLEDCLAQVRTAEELPRSEEPTVVCALAQLSATAFIARVSSEMPQRCARCAMEATLNVCASCQVAPACPHCRMCWGCYGGWLPEDLADVDDAAGGAS